MVSSYTTNKFIEKPAHNDYIDDWDVPVNNNSDIIDACLGDVSYVNMTGRSSYTLTAGDIQSAVIVFQNSLNDATVPVYMPNGVSGQFTFVNATSAVGASSILSLQFISGTVSAYTLNQGSTQEVFADGNALTWFPAAAPATPGVTTISMTGQASFAPTEAQLRNHTWVLTGTALNTSVVILFPTGTSGLYTFVNAFANGGGSTIVVAGWAAGGTPLQLNSGARQLFIAYNAGANVWAQLATV